VPAGGEKPLLLLRNATKHMIQWKTWGYSEDGKAREKASAS